MLLQASRSVCRFLPSEARHYLRKLQARTDIQRVLVICPKPLITERKWESEMKRYSGGSPALAEAEQVVKQYRDRLKIVNLLNGRIPEV